MRAGISTACFFKKEVNEQALIEIAKLGVKDVELFFSGLLEYDTAFVDELLRIKNGEGLNIGSVHALSTQFEPQLFSDQQRQFEEALFIYEKVLEASQRLGAELYVFHGPVHLKIARRPNLDMEFVGERLTLLCEMAKKYGNKLCYENVHWCWYNMPGFAQQLREHTHTDNLYFTLDMKQAAQSGFPVEDYIKDMGSQLAHVHVCDYVINKEQGVAPVLPFRGEADWQSIRRLLQQGGYDGRLMLEVYASNYDSYDELLDCYHEVERFFNQPASHAGEM